MGSLPDNTQNMQNYRGRTGIFSINITGALTGGTVWGTDIYTDDSYIKMAAVHAGVIQNGESKTVYIEMLPGQSSYQGTTRNGVSTSSYGPWGGSYKFVSSGSGSCNTSAIVPGTNKTCNGWSWLDTRSQYNLGLPRYIPVVYPGWDCWTGTQCVERQELERDANAQRELAAEAERQRQAAIAAENQRLAAIAAAKTAAAQAIAAGDAAIAAAAEAVTVSGGAADANSAKTAADTARTKAGNAEISANNAQTTEAANSARTAAENAFADANAAKAAANTAKAAAEARSLNDIKTSAIATANEAITIADSAVAVADEAIALSGPSVAAAQIAKTEAGLAKLAANDAKTSAERATTAPVASAAKIAATDAKTKATTAKTAADAAKAGNVTAAEAKCKTPVLMKFTAKIEPIAANPAIIPTSPNVYWTIDSTGPNKEIIWIPSTDKSGGNNNDALTYCGKIGKFLILYNNATKDRNIQYKILGVEKTYSNSYYKFNVEKVGSTIGFTKGNLKDNQDIYIRTSETQVVSQGPSAASSTFKNACSDPKKSANCKPVCIPTDKAGNIIYREGTSVPNKIIMGKNQWLANYYEYKPVRGIGSDGSVQYLPMDPSKTFVGPGTDCAEPCPPQDAGGVRPSYCKPPDPNYGKKGATGAAAGCPIGCIKVDDPTDPRNKSVCKFDKMDKLKAYTCGATCDFAAGSECKKTSDCGNCKGDDYTSSFPLGWTKSSTRKIEDTYTADDCKMKCKKPTIETCRNFLQLEQSGGYLESKCHKIGANDNKVICKPISKVTPNGLVAGYDGCNVCKKETGLYGFFEYKKQWNSVLKQWDFVNIKEIPSPSTSWFEGETNYDSYSGGSGGRVGAEYGGAGSGAVGGSRGAGAGSGGSGYGGVGSGALGGSGYGGAGSGGSGGAGAGAGAGAGSGYGARDGSGSGTNMRSSEPSGYQEDEDTRGARDSREMGKIQSNNNSKYVSISSASQIAKRQQQSANVSDLKLRLDKMNRDYADLLQNVKWDKMQMDKAEKDCNDMNVKYTRAAREYALLDAKSIKVGATIKDKKDTEAANTLMYTIKQKAREICDNYGVLKDKYMKSINELNTLKNKIGDLTKQYDTANTSMGSGGGTSGVSGIGSALAPIINIFFGDDVNRDCSGQLGCGSGIDYSFPSPFDSSKGGMFVPKPYYDGINF